MKPQLVSIFIMFWSSTIFGTIYINVSGAQVKKAKLAVGRIHSIAPEGLTDPLLKNKIREQIFSDLELTNLFEFLEESFYSHLDGEKDLYNIRFEEWGISGASFLLKLAYKEDSENIILEANLYDIIGSKKIFGTRYEHPKTQYVQLVHALAEDILKEMTGERGLFLSRIAMVCRKGKGKEIYLSDPDGHQFTEITHDKSLILSPSWSPDGKFLAYTQYEWRLDKKLNRPKIVPILKKHEVSTGERIILSDRDGINSGASWSPKGDRIALTLSFSGKPELYFISPQSVSEPESISREIKFATLSNKGFQPHSPSLFFDVEPHFSPDGQKLVFSSARTGRPMIYTVDLLTKIANQLTFAGQYNATPAWSPKGDKILFAAQQSREGHFDIYIIEPDGNNLARLTRGSRNKNSESPKWSQTGRHFVFANNEDGMYGIYIMTIDGAIRRKISPPGRECTNPAWSSFWGG